MTRGLRIQVIGTEKLKLFFSMFREKIGYGYQDVLDRTARQGAVYMQGIMPSGTGLLRDSVKVRAPSRDVRSIGPTGAALKYAQFVDEGRHPTLPNMPNVGEIANKFGGGDIHTGYIIARAMASHSRTPSNYMQKTTEYLQGILFKNVTDAVRIVMK